MVTPARSCEEGSSRDVTCLVQPPFCIRRCVRSNEYQMGRISPRSVLGGKFDFGLIAAIDLLTGPGLLADRFCSPFRTSARVCPNVGNATAPALIAPAAAPNRERRLAKDGWLFFIVVSFTLRWSAHFASGTHRQGVTTLMKIASDRRRIKCS